MRVRWRMTFKVRWRMTFKEWWDRAMGDYVIIDDYLDAYRAGIEAAALLIEAEGMMAAEYLARRIRELKDE
jgi:hypothetical protein